jgi:transposase
MATGWHLGSDHEWHIATRYDQLAANYLALIKLASIRLWIRAYESTP